MKNRKDSDELWDDLLDDVASSEFRRTLLAQTVGAARRRRRRRLIGAVACLAAPILLFALMQLKDGGSLEPELADANPESSVAPGEEVSGSSTAPPTGENPSRTEILTDDELFALFPDHVVGLVGPAGEQRLIVLGER